MLNLLFVFSKIYSQTACLYRPNQDNPSWIDPTHWVCLSPAAQCAADIPKYPVANDDVISPGYNILVNIVSRTVNNITMTAGNFFPAKLTVQGGATLTCNNLTINSHATSSQEASLIIYGNGTTVQVNGNLTFNKPATNSSTSILGLFMASLATETPTLNVNGNLVFNHLNGALGSGGTDNDSIEFDVAGTSTVNVEGTTTFVNELGYTRINIFSNAKVNFKGGASFTRQNTTGSLQIILEDNAELNIGTNITPANATFTNGGTAGAGRDVIIDIEGNAKMNVYGNMNVTHTGGDDVIISVNPNSSLGTKGRLVTSGNLTINSSLSADDIKISALQDSSYIGVGGKFSFTSNTPNTRLEITLDKGGKIKCSDFNVTQIQGNGVLITTNNTPATPIPKIEVADTFEISTINSSFFTTIDLNRGELIADKGIFSLNNGSSLRLFIDGSSHAQFTSDVYAIRNGGDSVVIEVGQNPTGSTAQLSVGGNLFLDNNVITSNRWVFLKGYQNSTTTVTGNIELKAEAADQTRVQLENNAVLRMGGSFKRPNAFGYFAMYDNSTLELIGTSPQYIIGDDTTGNGTDFNNYKRVVINNTSSTVPQVVLTSDATIESRLVFNNGVIGSTPGKRIILIDNAQAGSGTVTTFNNNDGGKPNSFVIGTMRKIGDDTFIFPVGDTSGGNLIWAPIGIISPSGTSTFDAEYRYQRPANYNNLSSGLAHISGREYWNLDRTSGSASAQVRLFWKNAERSMIDDITSSDLRIARYNGTTWQQHSGTILPGSTIGPGGNGAITTSSALSTFSPFTFGSNSFSVNPLLTDILDFRVERKNEYVIILYQLSPNSRATHIKIQKSYNGTDWLNITERNLLLSHFEDFEPNSAYYRLALCESSCSYSTAKWIYGTIPTIKVSKVDNEILVEGISPKSELQLFDVSGKMVAQTTSEENHHIFKKQLVEGMYILKVVSLNGTVQSIKFKW
ncbi:MAG: T9SS type A sorting domain-containing protein [Cytophagales bacterium]|nr:T9SS type A sorting domain-containing protein [Cytophagales bacterium]MDW8383563.1 T9SS type A sorting domain-containing protein [Flammeovirgaceae bacterium]